MCGTIGPFSKRSKELASSIVFAIPSPEFTELQLIVNKLVAEEQQSQNEGRSCGGQQ